MDFNPNQDWRDQGILYQSAKYYRWYRATRSEELKAYFREYNKQRYITHPEAEHARRKRYAERWPEKIRAHQAVRNERNKKKTPMVKMPCVNCKKLPTYGHHEDYMKPLWVIWYCAGCHSARHKEMRDIKKP